MKMNSHWCVLAVAVLCTTLGGRAASAADIPFDQFLQQQHYGAVTTDMYRDMQVIEAQINGQKIRLIVEDDSSITALKKSTAWDLGLKIRPSHKEDFGRDGRLFGISGFAPISSFTIQGWAINRPAELEVLPGQESGGEAGGVLGYDYLKLNNAIILAGNSGFLLRPGFRTPAAGLAGYMRSSGYTGIPLRIFHDRLVADGNMNGSSFVANINSSADTTVFLKSSVQNLKLELKGSGRSMASDDENTWAGTLPLYRRNGTVPLSTFTFKNMSLGSFQVPVQEFYTGRFPALEELHIDSVIGKDFLADHQAIIDAGSDTLWLK